MTTPLPYIIYWLVVKDFLYNLDLCENDNGTGYCLSDLQCNDIANGTSIGSCDPETSGSVCCKITLNYFNETYSLNPIFVMKSQTDTAIITMLFNRKDIAFYDPKVHICEIPDRIFWPITVYYSRESRDLDKQASGEKYLYAITLEKMEKEEKAKNLSSECISESKISDESDSGDKFYLYINSEVVFPIRKFFTPEIQKLSNVDSADNIKSLFEAIDSDKRSRRSLNHDRCNKEDSTCEEEHLDDIHTVENKDEIYTLSTQSEISHIHSEKRLHQDINTMYNPLESELNTKQLKVKDTKESSSEKQYKPIPYTLVHNEQFHDSNKASHVLEKPMQVEATQNIRKFEQVVNPDMRKSVQTDVTHDMRKAVKTEATHDLRKPVQNEATHDMRKPVALDESHDLRWPVVEGETDLRSIKSDVYQNILPESKFRNVVINYIRQDVRMSRLHDSGNIDQILRNFLLHCKMNASTRSKIFNLENPSGKENGENLKDVWEEASTVCGRHSVEAEEKDNGKMKSKWPWMVSLLEKYTGKYTHKCSGALLNNLWVITVAHCVDKKNKSNLLLVLGNQNSQLDKEYRIEMEIDEILVHPNFNRGMLENDVALLRMKTAVELNSDIGPICLPWNIRELKFGTSVYLSWRLKQKTISEDFQKMTVPLITNYECGILYSTDKSKESIRDTFLCAGKNEENCDSESGSSLIAPDSEGRWSLIGLVSWGSMCSNLEEPGVYARISSYMQWIKDVIDCYEYLM